MISPPFTVDTATMAYRKVRNVRRIILSHSLRGGSPEQDHGCPLRSSCCRAPKSDFLVGAQPTSGGRGVNLIATVIRTEGPRSFFNQGRWPVETAPGCLT